MDADDAEEDGASRRSAVRVPNREQYRELVSSDPDRACQVLFDAIQMSIRLKNDNMCLLDDLCATKAQLAALRTANHADVFVRKLGTGRLSFPHECILKRKNKRSRDENDTESPNDDVCVFNNIASNTTYLSLGLYQHTAGPEYGAEQISADGLDPHGLSWEFGIYKTIDNSRVAIVDESGGVNVEWKDDSLREVVTPRREATNTWRFRFTLLSSDVGGSSFYIHVKCTTANMGHLEYKSPEFFNKSRRDGSRRHVS